MDLQKRNKIFFFITLNSFLMFIGASLYILTKLFYNFVYLYFLYLLKTYILLFATKYIQANKTYISHRGDTIIFNSESHINIWISILIETLTHIFIVNSHTFIIRPIIYDIITFIPYSFLFELTYDFMHYWIHRLLHTNTILYKYIHKKHHVKVNTTILDTYYQNPIDLILSNSIPFYISLIIHSHISYFQFILLAVYKTAVEIAGHTGKKTYPTSSFPQFPWLVKYFYIELYTENHDLHHRYLNCNYSKRLSLWDKIFQTYRI